MSKSSVTTSAGEPTALNSRVTNLILNISCSLFLFGSAEPFSASNILSNFSSTVCPLEVDGFSDSILSSLDLRFLDATSFFGFAYGDFTAQARFSGWAPNSCENIWNYKRIFFFQCTLG